MTFEEWWQQYVKPSHFYEVEQTAKEAWDYQQQRIYELEEKVDSLEVTLDTIEAALGKR